MANSKKSNRTKKIKGLKFDKSPERMEPKEIETELVEPVDTAKITITMNVDQAYVLMGAMEFYARIHIGQFDHLEWTFINHDLRRDFIWRDQDNRDELRKHLNAARDIIFPELSKLGRGASHGIHSTEIVEGAHDAWDIYQSVRRALAIHRNPNPKGIDRWSVSYDKPYGISKKNPLPVVEMVPEGLDNQISGVCDVCGNQQFRAYRYKVLSSKPANGKWVPFGWVCVDCKTTTFDEG